MTEQRRDHAPAPPSAALDREVLANLREALGDESGEFVASLATVYESQAVTLMAELDEAAHDSDAHRLGFAAHSLKGSSANIGGNRLAGMCSELEHWGGAPGEMVPRVAMIRTELSALLAELRVFVPR